MVPKTIWTLVFRSCVTNSVTGARRGQRHSSGVEAGGRACTIHDGLDNHGVWGGMYWSTCSVGWVRGRCGTRPFHQCRHCSSPSIVPTLPHILREFPRFRFLHSYFPHRFLSHQTLTHSIANFDFLPNLSDRQ